MSFADWIEEFEMFTICMLPRLDPEDDDAGQMAEQEALDRDHRVIGTFIPGIIIISSGSNITGYVKGKMPRRM